MTRKLDPLFDDFPEEEEIEPEVFTNVIEFPRVFSDKVLGENNSNIKDIQSKTGCSITVEQDESQVYLKLSCLIQYKVFSATKQIDQLLQKSRKGIEWNYFIAVNCSTDPNFNKGIKKYLDMMNSTAQLEELAYDNIYRLHVTLMELVLSNDKEIEKVGNILKKTVSEFNWRGGDHFDVTGIKTFADFKTPYPRIYYGEPKKCDTMEILRFLQNELAKNMKKEHIYIHDVTNEFHITVCRNTWFKVRNSWGTPEQLRKAESFPLPPAPIKTITLCKRYVWKPKHYWFVPASQDLNCLS
ncbi:KH domain containing protein [Histomonas meleagridis]|uniref:KH domain containing protein n=1 Tax=Histomonas meleagridis TaxID=135588 RepID=UPI00355A702F|nr:KH domain containing protein [Histomonas meleagridis]KAH0797789.1 KH domain containing protein [Histomonas meleagridis]